MSEQLSCQHSKCAVNTPSETATARTQIPPQEGNACSRGITAIRKRVSGDEWVSQETMSASSQLQMCFRRQTRSQSQLNLKNTSANTHCSTCLDSYTGMFCQAIDNTDQCLDHDSHQTFRDMDINCKATRENKSQSAPGCST